MVRAKASPVEHIVRPGLLLIPFLNSLPKNKIKAWTGLEPVNNGFADRCLTTWLPRHIDITRHRIPRHQNRNPSKNKRRIIKLLLRPSQYPPHPPNGLFLAGRTPIRRR